MSSAELCPGGHAWITGPRAHSASETALERFATEIRDGRHVWATGIRQDGMMLSLSASSGAASLLCTADRQSLRLMIVGGDGWTFVIHPVMGAPRSMRVLLEVNERMSEVRKQAGRSRRPFLGLM